MVEGLLQFLDKHGQWMLRATAQHILLSAGAVFFGALVAIPLGIWLTRHERIAKIALAVSGTIQTIPSLVFFGLILPVLGIGVLPAMVVLFFYSILPILRNTYTGIKKIDPAYLEAGTGMGMNSKQLLFMVKLPLALPVIISGVRISLVYIISWATLAALIGSGGLGDLIISGLQTYDAQLIVGGAVPAAMLAVLAGYLLGRLEKALVPRGLRS
ncbi:ABC transporter permease [Calderihabitans maritimus]|uniref:Binding-protein-dependent transporters inner membrane component n=1 Tax=Calderihabitans maritimus TaxID=1246530 RepID=A0A1Z5HXI0_9FIRM|nr:ABC transporter permease [Calderihabitans maritimus]GAW94118.1 binding-protein-dependent transporters inner membrane component [Calderihabitans maritimus]